MKKFALVIAFILILTAVEITNTNDVNGKILYVGGGEGNYTTIQQAVNDAGNGDRIYIYSGVYHERVTVTKSISISGESKNGTVIDAGYNGSAVKLNSNGVKISNITIRNGGGGEGDALIKVSSAENEIRNCILNTCRNGILISRDGNKVSDCEISENGNGIELQSDSNAVSGCVFYKNGMGMEVINASDNTISGCVFHTNGIGLYMENSAGNRINRCNVYKNSGNEGGIFLIGSNENFITNSSVDHNVWSIRLVDSNKNEITGCQVNDSRFGIRFESANMNRIYHCNVTHNRYGIYFEKCTLDRVNFNNIENNHMYGLYAKLSTVNARYNWWGSVTGPSGNKLSPHIAKVSHMPWLIRPVNFAGKSVSRDKHAIDAPSDSISYGTANIHKSPSGTGNANTGDWDPLVDLKLKVKVIRVRNLGVESKKVFSAVDIHGMKNESNISEGIDIYPDWSAVQNVPDEKENIPVSIRIFEKGILSENEVIATNLVYNMERGEWYGDDYVGDENGYGHVVGNGYEMWFEIEFNDYDGDGLTYWEEKNVYHTDPQANDSGKDFNGDGIPIEWEDRWGYDPFENNSESEDDPDHDGLTNLQEWQQSKWLSDPFRKDIFMEVDSMLDRSGSLYVLPEKSKQMLYSSFTRHNIMMHIDDGGMGGGGEEIPYNKKITYHETNEIYWKYFLHNDITNERKGVFHYVIFCSYGAITRGGYSFQGLDNLDGFVLAIQYIYDWRVRESHRELSTASLFMHELGHNLGLFEYTFGGIDNESCNTPTHAGWWKYASYKSCLNYRYSFSLVDYSDGSRGENDYDDWSNINLSFFKHSTYY